MKTKRKYSFWQQLMGAVLVLMVAFLIFFLILFQWVKKAVMEQYTSAAEQSVDAVAKNVDYILRDIEVLSDSILTNRDFIEGIKTGNAEQIQSNLESAFISNSHVDGIYTLTNNGYFRAGAEIEQGIKDFPKQELQDTSGEILWFPTYEKSIRILSGNVAKQYFSMGRKIIDVNSLEGLGYLNIQVNEWQLQESYGEIRDDQSKIIICTNDGKVVSDSDNELNDSYIEDIGLTNSLFKDIGTDTVSREYRINNVPYVAISASCNGGSWRLVKVTPRLALYEPVNDMQMYMLIWGTVIIILAIGAAYWYSRRISQPITILQNSMKEVEQGNMETQVDIQVRNELDDLGSSFNHMVRRVNGLMGEVVVAEKQKNELELEVLHAQINPHFLYNTLNTIRWMAKIKGEDSISTAIVALVKLLRVSISLSKNMITLREEIEYVKNYLTIQRLRFNQLFTIEYDIPPEHEGLSIPKMILQPIVENSLIYGIEEGEEMELGLTMRIFTRENGGRVEVVVEDNGPGMEKEVVETIFRGEKSINKFSKVGLNNINQRIKMYFGEDYGLQIHSAKGEGTSVLVTIPKVYKEGETDV